MTTSKRKRNGKDDPTEVAIGDGIELFKDAPVDENEGSSDESEAEEDYQGDTEENSDVEESSDSEYSNIGEDEESSEDEGSSASDEDNQPTLQKKLESAEIKTIQTEFGDEDPDTSDEEDIRNTAGNIPMEWYEALPHIGYDLDGKKILKPIRNADELDKFLNKMDNPDFWKTIYDPSTARDHVLTKEQLEFIGRVKAGMFSNSSYDPYEPFEDIFTHEKMIHPINNAPAHKRSFIPSLDEKKKVGRMVHAIKQGWLHPPKPKPVKPDFYDLWGDDKKENMTHSELARLKMHVPAPKVTPPTHAESYNPPPEYLFNEEEKLEWENTDKEDRKLNFVPQTYDCLRKVPQYSQMVQERFARCLDLYLCPRIRKMRMNVDPSDLIPKLPKPQDLQPFPTTQALCYKGHSDLVRTISAHCSGQWIASGSDDKTVRVWEVNTGRCVATINVTGIVKCVSWCPNASVCLLAAVINDKILLINPHVGDRLVCQATDQLIESFEKEEENVADNEDNSDDKKDKKKIVEWSESEIDESFKQGLRLILKHPRAVSKVTWHPKGDYFASVMPGSSNTQVLLHQLTKRRSQNPFSKCKGLVQTTLFHPTRPFLFVATQRFIRVYNLVKQELTKKLMSNAKWVSCLAVHPGGDNVIIGSYDCRLSWLDMDLSVKPYKTLRYHKKAVRSCCFHRKYPLFASCADDGTVVVCHGMVYSDLMQNPLIVPVKVLKGHKVQRNLGVLDCCFHPNQPWIFSSAADNTVRLFT